MIKVCHYVDYIQSVFQKKKYVKLLGLTFPIWHTGTQCTSPGFVKRAYTKIIKCAFATWHYGMSGLVVKVRSFSACSFFISNQFLTYSYAKYSTYKWGLCNTLLNAFVLLTSLVVQ